MVTADFDKVWVIAIPFISREDAVDAAEKDDLGKYAKRVVEIRATEYDAGELITRGKE